MVNPPYRQSMGSRLAFAERSMDFRSNINKTLSRPRPAPMGQGPRDLDPNRGVVMIFLLRLIVSSRCI